MHELLNNQLWLRAGCDHMVRVLMGPQSDFLTTMKAEKDVCYLRPPFSPHCLQVMYPQAQHLVYQSVLLSRKYWCAGTKGSWIMSCRLQPGSDEWRCGCLLCFWDYRCVVGGSGGLKGAEIHSSMCSAGGSCGKSFFPYPVWCSGKTP